MTDAALTGTGRGAAPRRVALVDTALVLGAFLAVRAGLHATGVGIGAGSAAVVCSVGLATWLLHRRGMGWSALGLRWPPSVGRTAAWTAALFLVQFLVVPAVVVPIVRALHASAHEAEVFATLRGNTTQYLIMLLPVTWGAAAWGEEMLFRGFLATRIADSLGGAAAAIAVAVVVQASVFGLCHSYLGLQGMLNAGFLGLAAGAAYVASGRNLWPPIIAHGLIDSIGLTLLYLGAAPGH
jgi:hypothetical protein